MIENNQCENIPPTILQSQINEIKNKVNEFDKYCKEKEYYNGRRQEKIDRIIEELDNLDKTQKEALKTLLSDSECRDNSLESRIDTHDTEINDIKLTIAKIPNEIIKNMTGLLVLFTVIIGVIIWFNDILLFILSVMH